MFGLSVLCIVQKSCPIVAEISETLVIAAVQELATFSYELNISYIHFIQPVFPAC